MAHKLEPEQTDNFELGRLLWSHVSPAGLSFWLRQLGLGMMRPRPLTMINIDRGEKAVFRADRGGTVFEHTAY